MSQTTAPIDVVFLWHMHQPEYTSPLTGRPVLPWVRMHATRAYLDMARLLARHPTIRCTVNFVPSLVRQLEAYLAGVRDDTELLCEKRCEEWSQAERVEGLTRLFSVNRQRGLEPRARYRELHHKRGGDHVTPAELRERADAFSPQELRDLVVLFHLASFGFCARSEDAVIAALDARGHGFSHEDVLALLERQRALAARVLPAWRALATRGQVELSTSPYYHPILPLLIESDSARRAMPHATLPTCFAWPEDASAQIVRGKAAHERTFFQTARGMWPPEGSLSPEAVKRYAAEDVEWLVGDAGTLWRSFAMVPDSQSRPRGALYRPYIHAGVKLLFRDREISDRIGFSYAQSPADAAAHDLLSRVRDAGRQFREAYPGETPVVTIALDGENAWESYEGVGEPFLAALYGQLEQAEDLCARTISEALVGRIPTPLRELHTGSWINSDFGIWIGDPAKNRAWEELGDARRKVARVASSGDPRGPARAAAAMERIYQAEGSDWFWWFGEPFHSAEDAVFAAAFQAHLKGAYEALETEPPADLGGPTIYEAGPRSARAPQAFIHPRLDGRGDSFYEWHGAGRYDVPRGQAMAASKRYAERILFGFDDRHLYLRLDPNLETREELGAGSLLVTLRPSEGAPIKLELPLATSSSPVLRGSLGPPPDRPDELEQPLELAGARAAVRDVIELGLPFQQLGLAAGDEVKLSFRIVFGQVVGARLPPDGYLLLRVPDAGFEADHWNV